MGVKEKKLNQRRVHLSGLRYNNKFEWHSVPYKNVTGCSPGKYFTKFIETSTHNDQLKCRKRLITDINDNSKRKKIKTDFQKNQDYNPNAEEPDMEEDFIKSECEEILARLKVQSSKFFIG